MNRNREVWRDNGLGYRGPWRPGERSKLPTVCSGSRCKCVCVCAPVLCLAAWNGHCHFKLNMYGKSASLIFFFKKSLPDASSSLIGTMILLVRLSGLLDNLNFILPSFPESTLSSSWLTPFAFGTFFLDLHSHLTHSPAFSLPTSHLLDTAARYFFLKQYFIHVMFSCSHWWSLVTNKSLTQNPFLSYILPFIQGWLSRHLLHDVLRIVPVAIFS